VIRDLGLPCARTTELARCPRHALAIGPTARICMGCHHEAWDETARRYREQGKLAEPDRPPLQTFPGPKREPLAGQLALLEDTTRKENPMDHEPKPTGMRAELVPIEGELVDANAPTPTLFGTADPRVALERMSEIARVLVDVVRDRKLSTRISGRDYLSAEAWTTLGAMLGVVPVVVWTKPNESADGFVARVEARTLDGRIVGAAECECSRAEATWRKRDPHALRAMAQTRAVSRALRAPLGQIVVLAGYEPAGADELAETDTIDTEPSATTAQHAEIRTLIGNLEQLDPSTDWKQQAREIACVPAPALTRSGAEALISMLRGSLAERDEEKPAA
jgi:hypothetical protein